VATQVFQVAGMCGRERVRAISARVSDVPGVRTVEARLDTGTVRVTGTADPAAVLAAIRLAGCDAVAWQGGNHGPPQPPDVTA
jgi:copper chaperone CopZ